MTVFVLTNTHHDEVDGDTHEWDTFCSHECAGTSPHYVAHDRGTWEEGETEYPVALFLATCQNCGGRVEQTNAI